MILLFAGYGIDKFGGLEDLESIHVDFSSAENRMHYKTENYDWYHLLDTETLNMKFYDQFLNLVKEQIIHESVHYYNVYNIESIYP